MKTGQFLGKLSTILSILTFLLLPHVDAAVLDDAKEYQGHYYKIIDKQLLWDDAKYYCQSMGGHLVTLDTREENNMVRSMLKALPEQPKGQTPKRYWVGGEMDARGFWRWIDGKLILYSGWIKGAPSHHGNIKMFIQCSDDMLWNDYMGDEGKYGCICEWDRKESARESNW